MWPNYSRVVFLAGRRSLQKGKFIARYVQVVHKTFGHFTMYLKTRTAMECIQTSNDVLPGTVFRIKALAT